MQIVQGQYSIGGKRVDIRWDNNAQVCVAVVWEGDTPLSDFCINPRRHGDNLGDRVLTVAADVLCRCLGPSADPFVRYGRTIGTLPKCSHSDIEDLRREIERYLP